MNINTISASVPKFQTAKAACNVNFTGLGKAAQNIGNTAGEAAANAAKKLGITEQITKVLSYVLEGVKNLGQKILRGIKKLFNVNINKNNNNVYSYNNIVNQNNTVGQNSIINGREVFPEEFSDTFDLRNLDSFINSTMQNAFPKGLRKKGLFGLKIRGTSNNTMAPGTVVNSYMTH